MSIAAECSASTSTGTGVCPLLDVRGFSFAGSVGACSSVAPCPLGPMLNGFCGNSSVRASNGVLSAALLNSAAVVNKETNALRPADAKPLAPVTLAIGFGTGGNEIECPRIIPAKFTDTKEAHALPFPPISSHQLSAGAAIRNWH